MPHILIFFLLVQCDMFINKGISHETWKSLTMPVNKHLALNHQHVNLVYKPKLPIQIYQTSEQRKWMNEYISTSQSQISFFLTDFNKHGYLSF